MQPLEPGTINESEPAGFGYIYSVDVNVGEAEQFYMETMETDGWTLANRQTNETSMFGGPATSLDFARDGEDEDIICIFG